MKIDLSGRAPVPQEIGPIEVGDIMQTRQGRLYLIMALPGLSRQWRTSEFAYYFSINSEGELQRVGQVLVSYIEANWTKVGHCDFALGEPEWF